MRARRRLGLDRRDARSLSWLFVATLPNSGSTALANILDSAPRAIKLTRTAEGQWLVPQMRGTRRWDPRHRLDLDLVRAVWLDRALKVSGAAPRLVIEKSPPNLSRFRNLVAAFRGMPTHVVRFSRDPYAVCASWSKRYGPRALSQDWGHSGALDGEEGFYRALGGLCGQRMALLADLGDISDVDIAYEALTDDPRGSLDRLVAAVPMLEGADPAATVEVKDYAPQALRNMNEAQIAKLTAAQIDAITEGLAPNAAAVEALGYRLR